MKNSDQDTYTETHPSKSNNTKVDSNITNSNVPISNNTSSNNSNSSDSSKGYVAGEGTKFAYNIGRAGGLINGNNQETEDQFYQNYSMDDNTVTYNGKTVEYNKVNRPDGTYYYSVTPVN
ncbi:hypothetical protein H5S40_06015 [Limosilactobacillus sp. RRLNB_1_1]|nr:hypothetical protein [Limosilactobacillus albertensis]MBB1069705.1 hypothetical protein [Limosilactobacillus albertensis]